MRHKNVNQLMSSGLIYGVGGALSGALSFIALPFIARYLSPEEYGVIAILLMLGMAITALFSMGLGTSIGSRYFNKTLPEERVAVISGALAVLLASACILAILGLWNAESIGILLFQASDYTHLVKISVMTSAIGLLVQPWRLKLQFEQRPKRFIVASFGSSIFSFALIILFVVILKKSVIGYLYALLLGQAVSLALFFFLAKGGMSYRAVKEDIRALIVEGVPLIPSFVFLFLIQNAARYFLQSFHGLGAVGILTMGTSIGLAMGVFIEAFVRAWVPFSLSYMNRQEEARELLARLTQHYLVVFGYLVLLFFFFSKPAVMIIFPEAYWDTHEIIGLAAASQFFLGLFSVLLPSIYFAKKLYVSMLVQALCAVVSLIMYMTIIPEFGAIGAGVAVMSGNMLMALLMLTWVRMDPDCHKIDYPQRKIYKILASMAALSQLPLLMVSENWWLNMGYAVLCSILSAAILIRMGRINLPEVWREVLRMLRRSKDKDVLSA